jgi:hypothetical protein
MVIGKSQQTMCIGADLAWWGGTKSKASQADHVWSGWVTESGTISGLKHSQVSLAGSETTAPPPWPEGPHRDPFGIRFLATLNNLIQATGAPDRILIGIDAPLEAEVLDSEVPRQKCYRKGEVSETRNRKCERELRCHIRAVATEWAKDVRIQAGAPLIPRVSSIVDELKTCGFALGAGGRTLTGRDLVEVFPSASIGALGAGGAYGTYNAVSVRLYKTLRQFSGREEALKLAAASLLGFQWGAANPSRKFDR